MCVYNETIFPHQTLKLLAYTLNVSLQLNLNQKLTSPAILLLMIYKEISYFQI